MDGKDRKKDECFWKILSCAIELDVKKGHLKWTLTDLSRKCDITRSLIYYYFGRSKENILKEATTIIGTELSGLGEERLKLWEEGRIPEAIIEARKICDRIPYVANFMIQHRNNNNEIGKAMVALEQRYMKKVKRFFPEFGDDQVKALWAFFWGLCFAPMVDDKVIEAALIPFLEIAKRASK